MIKSQIFVMKIPWPPSLNLKKFVLISASFLLLMVPSTKLENLAQNSIKSNMLSDQHFENSLLQNEQSCPKMIPRYFANVQARAGFDKEQIIYKKKEGPKTKEECVQLCCITETCNIVFMYLNNTQLTCYHVSVQFC